MIRRLMPASYELPQNVLRLAALLCALIATVAWVGPNLLRVDLYSDDAAQHIFWLYRYADPALLPGDLTARFFSLPSSAPWGFRSLYAALAPWVDVLAAAEVVAVVLLLLSLWLAWLIGCAISPDERRELGGLIAVAAAAWLIPQQADVFTPLGLQRSFAYPIVLLCLWALVTRRYFWVGVAWLGAALFYPVILVVLGLAGAVSFLWDTVRNRRLPPFALWNIAAGAVALALVVKSAALPADIGPQITGAQALAMPEFGLQGRLRLSDGTLMGDWVRSQLTGLGWRPRVLLAMAVAAVLIFALGARRRLPRAAWVLLGSGVSVWLIARLTMFTLYLPNRHSRWAIAAFAVVVFTLVGVALFDWVKRRLGERAYPSLLSMGFAALAVCAVAVAFASPALHRWHEPVDRNIERAYAFIATLPRDALIAAHPDVADFVPLRSHRSVLASTETSLPFMQGYYARLKPRLEASLRAAYASSWEELDRTLVPYGVTAVLTAPRVWKEESYYEPFDALVTQLRANGAAHGFVLQHPPPERILFQSGDVYVVRAGPLNGGTPALATAKN